jgi:hypothetical protein
VRARPAGSDCVRGGARGWIGADCEVCDEDVYGEGCEKTGCVVGVNCTGRCVGDTGECLEAATVCPEGFSGEDCGVCRESRKLGDNGEDRATLPGCGPTPKAPTTPWRGSEAN